MHLLNAAICDDDPEMLRRIEELAEENGGYDAVEPFASYAALEQAVRSGHKYQAVFMDVELGTQDNGIAAAEKLCMLLPDAGVVVVTSYPKYSQDIFFRQINLTGFLLKPVEREKFDAVTELLMKRTREQEAGKLVLRFRKKTVLVSVGEIRYLESVGHTILVHLADGRTEQCGGKLEEMMDRLPDYFMQCHKSYLVNMKMVREIRGDKVVLTDGEPIAISRSRYAECRDAYFAYLGRTV